MDWVKWLIPLVVVFVIILSNLARITQEEKKRLPPRRRPGGDADLPPRPRRSPSEVDRFLEEVHRRRREADQQRAPVVKARVPVRSPVADRPARRETPSLTQDIPSVVPPTLRSPARVPAPIVVTPTRQPPAVIAETLVARGIPVPAPATPPGGVTAGAAAAVVAPKPDTPVAASLRQLLRSPQTLKAAIVLREVLAGPLCRRRHRGH
jgi:hypothetical protein